MYYNRIPGIGEVRLDDGRVNILPVYQSPFFQMLRHRKQLGQVHLVFPGATHSRLEHSLGAFARTMNALTSWHQQGFINVHDLVTVCVYAALHDIGHPPFSHTIEPLLHEGHHALGIQALTLMSKEIEACGTTVADVIDCFEKTNPLAAVVSDGSLGLEKIDYLWRDAHHTGFGGMPETDMVSSSLTMHDNRLVLHKRGWLEAMNLVRFSHRMFEQIYESSKSAYARRLIQKMYERLMQLNILDPSDLLTLTDAQLEGLWGNHEDPGLRTLQQAYTGRLPMPLTGLVICKKPWLESYARREKNNRVICDLEPEKFDALSRIVTWKRANSLERQLADLLDQMNPNRLFLVPSREERRYRVPNISILDHQTIVPIAEVAGAEIETINATASRVSVIRLGTNDPDALSRICKHADALLDTLLGYI